METIKRDVLGVGHWL